MKFEKKNVELVFFLVHFGENSSVVKLIQCAMLEVSENYGKLHKLSFQPLPIPWYSSDLVLSDYLLFSNLSRMLAVE